MEIKATLSPGQNGTKQLLKQYGERLVCVRYRYDKPKLKRYKTVELIVDEQDWIPNSRFVADRPCYVLVDYEEVELRNIIKNAGGRWDKKKKAWLLMQTKVRELALEHRVVTDDLHF